MFWSHFHVLDVISCAGSDNLIGLISCFRLVFMFFLTLTFSNLKHENEVRIGKLTRTWKPGYNMKLRPDTWSGSEQGVPHISHSALYGFSCLFFVSCERFQSMTESKQTQIGPFPPLNWSLSGLSPVSLIFIICAKARSVTFTVIEIPPKSSAEFSQLLQNNDLDVVDTSKCCSRSCKLCTKRPRKTSNFGSLSVWPF